MLFLIINPSDGLEAFLKAFLSVLVSSTTSLAICDIVSRAL